MHRVLGRSESTNTTAGERQRTLCPGRRVRRRSDV